MPGMAWGEIAEESRKQAGCLAPIEQGHHLLDTEVAAERVFEEHS